MPLRSSAGASRYPRRHWPPGFEHPPCAGPPSRGVPTICQHACWQRGDTGRHARSCESRIVAGQRWFSGRQRIGPSHPGTVLEGLQILYHGFDSRPRLSPKPHLTSINTVRGGRHSRLRQARLLTPPGGGGGRQELPDAEYVASDGVEPGRVEPGLGWKSPDVGAVRVPVDAGPRPVVSRLR